VLEKLGAPYIWNVCDSREGEGHDDVCVSGGSGWQSLGSTRRRRAESRRDVGWGPQEQGNTAMPGRKEQTNERGILTVRRDEQRCNGC
jgi:hypothetical protein